MDLLHKLADALATARTGVNDQNDNAEYWDILLKEVRDLDSVLYHPDKCKAARCVDGEHKCDQAEPCTRIAFEVLSSYPRTGFHVAYETGVAFIVTGISRALGELNTGEDRKIINEKLAEIGVVLEQGALPLKPEFVHDLKWMHQVAVRGLKLYAAELSRGWCHVHGKQSQFCAECANSQRLQALRYVAEAVKKTCSPETIQQLIGEAHQEMAFISLLQGVGSPAEREPHTGVGL